MSRANIRTYSLLLFLLSGIWFQTRAQVNIVPLPAELQVSNNHFIIDENTSIRFEDDNEDLNALGKYFAKHIRGISGHELSLNRQKKKSINLVITNLKGLGAEAYQLKVSSSAIHIKANSKAGIFYGLQSLIQTLPAIRTNELLQVPGMEIIDEPRFAWRGMMLDVSRHFYSVEAIKDILDLLALYKMNVFHWHLTDNEGWRLEIKKYPKLTSVGAWRKEIPGSVIYKKQPAPTGSQYVYGGFYTQEQAKEVVAYATARNITVVPEIEMPGHSGAALAAYPEFSCSQHPQATPNSTTWNGVVDHTKISFNYCAGRDSSFVFLQQVLDEVMQVFPSKYIHIGGDEVDKAYWEKCDRCQGRMQAEGLKTEEELQSYFIGRIEKHLLANNRKLLGWDEILEGGLTPSATVMSWRGENGGVAAAKQGHNAIMSPSKPLYFNRYQAEPEGEPFAAKASINTLENVYQYDPQPISLNSSEKEQIIGGQFAIWTEFISSVQHLQYMMLPRMPAIAEGLWSPLASKNYLDFVNRLNGWHFINWQQKGVRFHPLLFTSQTHEANRR